MLIVEGPDGSGKTTLIRELQERYGFEVAPRVVSKEAAPMTNLQDWVEDNLEKGFQDLIFDRHRLISQPIYGPIMGRTDPGFDDFFWLSFAMGEFSKIPAMVIYCIPPKDVVMDNVQNDPNNSAISKKISFIYDAYVVQAARHWSSSWERENLDRGHFVTIWDYTLDGREKDPLATFDPMVARKFNRRPLTKRNS